MAELSLGRYQITEQIGAGGMGVVYRARDQRLDRDVAVKVLPPGSLTDQPSRSRFRKEALALSRLTHPNIAVVHDFDTVDGTDFLVMELVPGMTLEQKLVAGPVSEEETLKLGIQLLEGLVAAHEQGVIHCDIKPSNLRITPDGRVKILDFGLAKFLKHTDAASVTMSVTQDHGLAGTLAYMPALGQLFSGNDFAGHHFSDCAEPSFVASLCSVTRRSQKSEFVLCNFSRTTPCHSLSGRKRAPIGRARSAYPRHDDSGQRRAS